jgi:hypothetical protein
MRVKQGLTLALAFLLFAAAAPALAGTPRHYPRGGQAPQPGLRPEFRIGIGIFEPDGDSRFWDGNSLEFTGGPSDLEDASVSAELLWPVGRLTSVHFSLGFFEGDTSQAYLDFIDESGRDIVHDSRLEIAPLTVGVMLRPFPGANRIAPYVGAGGGFYFWTYQEVGDFITFDSFGEPIEIVFADFETDSVALGYYLLAGIDVALGPTVSLYGEFRWQDADDDMDGDFSGLGEIDLSGRDARMGIAWKF